MILSEVPYAAGLYEGEGSIGAYYSKQPRAKLQLTIIINDEEPLHRFVEALGFGNVKGPYWRKKTPKPYWRIDMCNYEHAQAAIAMMWKWLSPRRKEQATLALTARHK